MRSHNFSRGLQLRWLERTPDNFPEGDANRGKKSSKSNWDCTICRSCRETPIGAVVLEKRENRLE